MWGSGRWGAWLALLGCSPGVEGTPAEVTLQEGAQELGYDLQSCNGGRTWQINSPGEPAGRSQVEAIMRDVGVESLHSVGVGESLCGDPEDLVYVASVWDWADVDPLVMGIGARLRSGRLAVVAEITVQSE